MNDFYRLLNFPAFFSHLFRTEESAKTCKKCSQVNYSNFSLPLGSSCLLVGWGHYSYLSEKVNAVSSELRQIKVTSCKIIKRSFYDCFYVDPIRNNIIYYSRPNGQRPSGVSSIILVEIMQDASKT